MGDQARRRGFVLRAAFALLACGAATFAYPNLIQRASAQTSTVTCTATCKNGSCTGNKTYCVCTCSFWTGSAVCNCTDVQSNPNPTAPTEETPTTTG